MGLTAAMGGCTLSEYQYYEFLAVDRPLSAQQFAEVRGLSSRAQVSSTRFVNTYNFGDFRGDPRKLMERYFDAHLYLANWGTHRLMLRWPRALLDLQTAQGYCAADSADAWATDTHVIVALTSENEGGDWEEDGEGLLASLVSVRGEVASGDRRALYLAWLLCAQSGELDEDDVEPPVPALLGTPSAALQGLADFLRIDEDLLVVASASSPADPLAKGEAGGLLAAWIDGLPVAEKNAFLLRVATGEGALLGAELLQRFRRVHVPATGVVERRTVGDLLQAAERQRAARERQAAARAAEEAARREREAAIARDKRLNALQPREEDAWRDVEARIGTKRPAEYDEAVRQLQDLQALAAREGRPDGFAHRLRQLREVHVRKVSLIDRLARAGLV